MVKLWPILWLIIAAGTPAMAGGRVRVLFTTFDPFEGRKANNTQVVGTLLKAHPEWISAATDVAVCNLPVAYGVAGRQALDCIQREQPDFVVSLGEADCDVRIESAANNLDDTPDAPDNAGVVRHGQEILPGLPARLGFAFPVEALMCGADPGGKAGVVASNSPENFVCNNVAFTLTAELAKRNLPFTFIHVPASTCTGAVGRANLAAHRIAKAAGAAERALAKPDAALEAIWRPESAGGRMPSSREEVATVLRKLQAAGAPACQRSYAERLLRGY